MARQTNPSRSIRPPTAPVAAADSLPWNRFAGALTLLLGLGAVVFVRLRLLSVPLERDEGEFAYAGQLLLQGVPPYRDLYSMKWPGDSAVYAAFMSLFGQTVSGIHFGLLLAALGTAVLTFVFAKKLFGPIAGAVAAVTGAVLSMMPWTFGLAAHATHFVILPALGGLLLLPGIGSRRPGLRLFLAGMLLGLASLMKQDGAVFALVAGFWLLAQELSVRERDWRRCSVRTSWLAAGFLLPIGLTAGLLAAAGVFDQFWFWTVRYAAAYARLTTLAQAFNNLRFEVGQGFLQAPALWAIAGVGLVLLVIRREFRQHAFTVLSFLAFSFLAVCPGGYFRGHYFLLLFPAIGLLTGVAVEAGIRAGHGTGRAALPLLIFLGAVGWSLYSSRAIFFQQSPAQVCRTLYSLNPFPEAIEIGKFIEAHCPPDARVAVIGSEPQIYFYSRRCSATGYIYMYPLLEPQPYARRMQSDMIREVTEANPAWWVFVSQPSSWLPQDNSDLSIINWFIQYRQDHLEPAGLIDIFPDGHTEYSWSGGAHPRSSQWLQIYRQVQR